MRKYVLANIKIPVLIDENGSFDMLNEYARTEITLLNKLPEIELDDNLYKRIIEFLQTNDLDKQEKVEERVPLQVGFKEPLNGPLQVGSTEPLNVGSTDVPLKIESARLLNVPGTVGSFGPLEQKLMICKNNIKMRKHADIMTFKNLTKGAKSYTRKMYLHR